MTFTCPDCGSGIGVIDGRQALCLLCGKLFKAPLVFVKTRIIINEGRVYWCINAQGASLTPIHDMMVN